ncbi:MAG: glycosyltransferase family 4 protein [Mycobacterium sp.]
MVAQLQAVLPQLTVCDTAEPAAGKRMPTLIKLCRAVRACRSVPGSDAVYIAVKADHGMWLNVAAALIARLCRARILLHHHSYTYIHERTPRMVALTRVAGPKARHIVLAESMACSMRAVMPEIHNALVINNAGLVDRSLLGIPLREDGADIVLGHLSNLFLDKGIAEVVDLALALHQGGTRVRLVVGGPTAQAASRIHLERAVRGLGAMFDYRGPLTGAAKHAFFEEITHFVFPSRYVHESAPLVLYEAMAAGAVCLSTRQGSIPEQLAGGPAVIADSIDTFLADALAVLGGAVASHSDSARSRDVYLRALHEFDGQFCTFVGLATGD